jgi:hypothetical protein
LMRSAKSAVNGTNFLTGKICPPACATKNDITDIADIDKPNAYRYRRYRNRPSGVPGEQAQRYGAEMTLSDWRERLVCSACGSREIDMIVTGARRRPEPLRLPAGDGSACPKAAHHDRQPMVGSAGDRSFDLAGRGTGCL